MDRLEMVVTAGITTTLTYDPGGRKVKLIDPDMGTWNYTYDAVSNLETQKDARLCETSMTYDKLERMLTKSFSGTCGGNTVHMSYDQGVNGIGRRSSMTDINGPGIDWSYDISYGYDERGRLTSEMRGLKNYGTFASAWAYNSADLIDTMRYPGGNDRQLGETVSYDYTQRMLASSATGDYTYLNSASYDPAGRLTQRVLGTNQAQSKYEYYPWTTQGGRLQQITAGTLGAPEALLKLQYGYDLNGNITSIQDYKMGLPQTQSFSYDNLNRLLTASAIDGLNGIGDYSQSYTYNSTTGNLETKAGAVYTYGNSLHPHAVMAETGGGSFTYDANGNMTNKTYPSSTTYTYNGDNRLTTVSGSASASFLYDGDGQRFAATINGMTTVYIGEYFEWQPATGQTSKYYFAGGQRIAMRVLPQGQTAAPLWLFGDHLGSTSVVANNNGSQHSRQGYLAWGEARFSIGSLPTKNQYTEQISHEAECH